MLTQTQQLLARLQAFTQDCRPDMHEPDEQNITAKVTGRKLDNAFTDDAKRTGEMVVTLKRRDQRHDFTFNINLANLIALARLVTPEQAATLDNPEGW